MAKPRVFVSSTYYDLKHIRSSLDIFIEDLGFEPILSEKGDIAYSPDIPLDESCYKEVETADIFVLIIGGRYGSEASGEEKKRTKSFFERYESITKKEYESALRKDTPTYILIESSVYSEYQTFLKNRENENVAYAHADSVNIFRLIEDILSKPRNNPTRAFERFSDIESWLRDQWAGLFRDMLSKRSQQQQLAALSLQVAELKETNSTMRKYLEAVMLKISPQDSTRLIKSEKKRLADVELREKLQGNRWWVHMKQFFGITNDQIQEAFKKAKDFEEFAQAIQDASKKEHSAKDILGLLKNHEMARDDFNEIRALLDMPPIKDNSVNITKPKRKLRRKA